MSDQPNPFRAPSEVSETRAGSAFPLVYVFACFLWSIMAIVHAIVRADLRAFFLNLEVVTPPITMPLLHPMATVAFFVVAATVILAGAVRKSGDRRKIGVIAGLLGGIALGAAIIGMAIPFVTVLRALSG